MNIGNLVCYINISPKTIVFITDDIQLGKMLPSSLYKLIRYEDLVNTPMEIMDSLFKFTGVPFTNLMRSYVYKHFHAEKIARDVK